MIRTATRAVLGAGLTLTALGLLAGAVHAQDADWGPPPNGGIRGCQLWVDPPTTTNVTVSHVTFDDAATGMDNVELNWSATLPYGGNDAHEVVFDLPSALIPPGEHPATFVAGWDLSDQTSTFSGTIKCSDIPPPPEETTTTTTTVPVSPPADTDHVVPPPVEHPQCGDETLPCTGTTSAPLALGGSALLGVGMIATTVTGWRKRWAR